MDNTLAKCNTTGKMCLCIILNRLVVVNFPTKGIGETGLRSSVHLTGTYHLLSTYYKEVDEVNITPFAVYLGKGGFLEGCSFYQYRMIKSHAYFLNIEMQ